MHVKTSELVQHDGSKWKQYQTPSGVCLTVTQAFRNLMHVGQPNVLNEDKEVAKRLLRLLHKYRAPFEEQFYDDVRNFIISWGEAEFFWLWDTNIGIREVLDDSEEQTRNKRNLSKMTKMDIIDHLLNLGSLPRWIKTPVHYAMLNIPRTKDHPSRNFVMMDKIDHGVTVQDIIKPRDNLMRSYVLKEFWAFYDFTSIDDPKYTVFKEEVEKKYKELVDKLNATYWENKAQLPEWLEFKDIFTDLFERNVVITYNDAPVGGSRISFWIIDQ